MRRAVVLEEPMLAHADRRSDTLARALIVKQQCIDTYRARYRDCRVLPGLHPIHLCCFRTRMTCVRCMATTANRISVNSVEYAV